MTKRLKVQWLVVFVNGCDGEFVTGDLRPCWNTRKAAREALKRQKGIAAKDYQIVKFVRAEEARNAE